MKSSPTRSAYSGMKETYEDSSSPCFSSPSYSTQSPSPSMRLWRPAAQRNVRNQWSKLHFGRSQWLSVASDGRAHATNVVNTYLSLRYLPDLVLGVLKDMPEIREKAGKKLSYKLDLSRTRLLSSYKDMVAVVAKMLISSRSMRCYIKGSVSSPVLRFSDQTNDSNDPGDGGGIPVYCFFSISDFDNLAKELVDMFRLELIVKRFLVFELLSANEDSATGGLADAFHWSNELYIGEFDDLQACELISEESYEPVPPRINDFPSEVPFIGKPSTSISREFLQVCLTTWLVDVNINFNRINEIFSIVEEEIKFKLS